jgi:hypothetical protein
MNLPKSKAQLIDTVERIQRADEKLSAAALDILADVLIAAIVEEYQNTAFKR